MKQENYRKVLSDGRTWYRIVALAKELDVTDQTIRNYIDRGIVIRMEDELGKPWVRLADNVTFDNLHRPCKHVE